MASKHASNIKSIWFVLPIFVGLVTLSFFSALKQRIQLAISSDVTKPLPKNLNVLIRIDESNRIEESAFSILNVEPVSQSFEGEYLVIARDIDNKVLWQTRTKATLPVDDVKEQGQQVKPYLLNVVVPTSASLYKVEFYFAPAGGQEVKLGQHIISDSITNWIKILMMVADK